MRRACIHGTPTDEICNLCDADYVRQNGAGKYQNPTLNERESTHGDYSVTAICAQKLKADFGEAAYGKEFDLNNTLDSKILESVDLILTKIARLASGDHRCKDTWRDIAGYAELVSTSLPDD